MNSTVLIEKQKIPFLLKTGLVGQCFPDENFFNCVYTKAMVLNVLLSAFFLVSCSTGVVEKSTLATKPVVPKEFARGEIILGSQFLTKIFDQDMAPVACVPDIDEAALLLRTLNPRMETVQDDIEALLDSSRDVDELIRKCDQDCTCSFLDDLLREHLVVLKKPMRKVLNDKKKAKDLNSCLNYIQSTFCESELFKTLTTEKSDFSFEDAP